MTNNINTETNGIWLNEYKIMSFFTDTNAQATIPVLCNLFQESAGNHAAYLKCDPHTLFQNMQAWVLTRISVNIFRLPKWQDNVTVKTWVVGTERFFSRRDFEITDSQGNILCVACSNWAMINLKTKRPDKLDSVLNAFHFLPEKTAIDNPKSKLQAVSNIQSKSERQVHYSDLDINNHVNNVKYVEWIIDTYSYELLQNNRITSLAVNYLNEARYGDKVNILTQQDNNSYKHSIQRVEDNKELCRIATTWEQEKKISTTNNLLA